MSRMLLSRAVFFSGTSPVSVRSVTAGCGGIVLFWLILPVVLRLYCFAVSDVPNVGLFIVFVQPATFADSGLLFEKYPNP
jgi:hypothetical protein